MKGICPTCDELVEIHCTGEPIGWTAIGGIMSLPTGSSLWKVICMHVDKRKEPDAEGGRPVCHGTGKRI